MRFLAVVLVAAALAAPAAARARTLVEVAPGAAPLLRAAGAEPVSRELSIWRTSSPALVRRLHRAGLVRLAEPERRLVRLDAAPPFTDPFVDREWWLGAIGVAGLTPPASFYRNNASACPSVLSSLPPTAHCLLHTAPLPATQFPLNLSFRLP